MGGAAKRIFELGGGFSSTLPQTRYARLRLPPSVREGMNNYHGFHNRLLTCAAWIMGWMPTSEDIRWHGTGSLLIQRMK